MQPIGRRIGATGGLAVRKYPRLSHSGGWIEASSGQKPAVMAEHAETVIRP
jgi:hypothetical protein